ncbi:MAG: pilus assembly protein PilP [Rhodocyclaceae bacterium]|nr:pilus assembly protein PilP [Rhodocyclaceae bacterium]
MRRVLSIVACALLSACGGEEHQDLKMWMKESTKDLRGRVPPLPEIKAFPAVSYEAMDLVDPFKPQKIEPEKKGSGGGIKPDLDRRKEPLEAFPLESLKMVGVLQRDKMIHAVVLAGKAVHQVKIGNYMGQNFGIITNITESDIQLRELVQDAVGDWVERTSSLHLQEQEVRK